MNIFEQLMMTAQRWIDAVIADEHTTGQAAQETQAEVRDAQKQFVWLAYKIQLELKEYK